jgi:N utilization substance protein B
VTAVRPSRKQARRDALFLLYQREVTDLGMDELLAGHDLREGYVPDDYTYAAELDATIGAHATGWKVERIAPLERSILRLALWEIESGSAPPQVAIDEAVRLAKRYSTAEAGVFVNGVLGAIQREREADDD